jgi:hypothetical protein
MLGSDLNESSVSGVFFFFVGGMFSRFPVFSCVYGPDSKKILENWISPVNPLNLEESISFCVLIKNHQEGNGCTFGVDIESEIR